MLPRLVGVWDARAPEPLLLRGASPEPLVDGGETLAACGFLPRPSSGCWRREALARLRRGEDPACAGEGDFSLAWAQPRAGRLTLARDPHGGQRLLWRSSGDRLYFATSITELSALTGQRPALDSETAAEALLSGDLMPFSTGPTLWAGVRELLPGQSLVVERGRVSLRRRPSPFLAPCRNGHPTPAATLERALGRGLDVAIADDDRVAVALSGGLDSATIAMLAVRRLGAERVCAFTYEFSDSEGRSEREAAAETARLLGIRHVVVTIGFDQFLRALPTLMRVREAPRFEPAAWVILARRAREEGYERILTGLAIENVLGANIGWRELGFAARWRAPLARRLAPAVWRRALFEPGASAGLRSALAVPPRHLYHLAARWLCRWGFATDATSFYPAGLRGLVERAAQAWRAEPPPGDRRPLDDLVAGCFDYYGLTRLHRDRIGAYAAAGIMPVVPALLAGCPELAAGYRAGIRDFRAPERELLAAGGLSRVVGRPKIDFQAVVSRAWLRRLAERARLTQAGAWSRLGEIFPGTDLATLERFYPETPFFALWMSLFLDDAPADAAALWLDGS